MHAIHELLGPIVAHAILGAAVAVLVFAAGLGVLAYGRRLLGRPFVPEDVVLGYPFGLVVVVLALYLALVHPVGAVIGTALLLAALWPLRALPPELRVGAAAAGRAALRAAPLALGFALVNGFLFHGATHDLNSHVLGDNAAWVSRTYSLQVDAVHYPDLTTLGYSFPRPEAATPIIAAALGRVLPIDFFLFGAAAMPMFLVLAVAGGVGGLRARIGPIPRTAPGLAVIGGLLVVGSLTYPSWVPETTTMALALPLALTVAWLTLTRVDFTAFLLVTFAILVAIVTTKILASVAVVAVLGAQLVQAYGPIRGKRLAGIALTALAAFLVAAALFFTSAAWILDQLHLQFLPWTAVKGIGHFLHRRTVSDAALALRVAGVAVLGVVLVRRRQWPLLTGLVLATASYWLISGQEFVASAVFVVLVIGACLLQEPNAGDRLPLAGAAALLAVGSWWLDQTEYRGSFALAVTLAAGGMLAFWDAGPLQVVLVSLLSASLVALGLAGHVDFGAVAAAAVIGAALLPRARLRVAAPVAVVCVLAVGSGAALARAVRAHDANFGVYDETVYPHQEYLVWRRVHAVSSSHTLVFTSLTGDVITPRQGWDYYAGAAGRQVYVAGWAASPLRVHASALQTRLRLNQEVLTGRLAPGAVPGAAKFTQFLAVLLAGEQHPSAFRRLYANDLYALYEIPTKR